MPACEGYSPNARIGAARLAPRRGHSRFWFQSRENVPKCRRMSQRKKRPRRITPVENATNCSAGLKRKNERLAELQYLAFGPEVGEVCWFDNSVRLLHFRCAGCRCVRALRRPKTRPSSIDASAAAWLGRDRIAMRNDHTHSAILHGLTRLSHRTGVCPCSQKSSGIIRRSQY